MIAVTSTGSFPAKCGTKLPIAQGGQNFRSGFGRARSSTLGFLSLSRAVKSAGDDYARGPKPLRQVFAQRLRMVQGVARRTCSGGRSLALPPYPKKFRCKWNNCRPLTSRNRATRSPTQRRYHRHPGSLVVIHRGVPRPIRWSISARSAETRQCNRGRAALHRHSGYGRRTVGAISRASLTWILRNAAVRVWIGAVPCAFSPRA